MTNKAACLTAFAPAKINLTLHVTGQRSDGYHLLDSLVVFADVGDRLWITPGEEMAIEVTGPFAAGVPGDASNLAWRAAELAGQPCHIRIEKNLPHGGGIGGGSSDAAAVLRALACEADCAVLGADVPVCRAARSSRMQGIGDQLTTFDVPLLNAVLVNPMIHVATPSVFAALGCKDNQGMTEFPTSGDFAAWLADQRNDLAPAACVLAPGIADVLETLSLLRKARLARMSGSGSTCFALFDGPSEAAEAAQVLSRDHPDWWVKACRLAV